MERGDAEPLNGSGGSIYEGMLDAMLLVLLMDDIRDKGAEGMLEGCGSCSICGGGCGCGGTELECDLKSDAKGSRRIGAMMLLARDDGARSLSAT